MPDLTSVSVYFEISAGTARRAIEVALARPKVGRSDFFAEVRAAFRREVAAGLEAAGLPAFPELQLGHTNFLKARHCVELGTLRTPYTARRGMEFCNGYGHEEYSLKALVGPRGISALPSLSAFKNHSPFCIGNVLCGVANMSVELSVAFGDGVRAVGYCDDISRRKKKSYLVLLGVQFSATVLPETRSEVCPCLFEDLDEIVIQAAYQYPPLYICRWCGQLYTCECFDGHFDIKDDLLRHLPYGGSEKVQVDAINKLRSRPRICSLCTGAVPPQKYGSPMYFSGFMQSYYPYHRLFSRKMAGRDVFASDDTHKEIENAVRERFGYPKIGERWISETLLFRVVQRLFSPLEVVHHYRGPEMEGLELDVWVPELRLGIEYQGVQHYREVKAWGGAEGLEKRRANDQKKKRLCRELGYDLVEFVHAESLSEDFVAKKLRRFILIARQHALRV